MADIDTLRQHASEERRRHSRRALLIVFVLCPAIAFGFILLVKLVQAMDSSPL